MRTSRLSNFLDHNIPHREYLHKYSTVNVIKPMFSWHKHVPAKEVLWNITSNLKLWSLLFNYILVEQLLVTTCLTPGDEHILNFIATDQDAASTSGTLTLNIIETVFIKLDVFQILLIVYCPRFIHRTVILNMEQKKNNIKIISVFNHLQILLNFTHQQMNLWMLHV
jgi:hypothetical protein